MEYANIRGEVKLNEPLSRHTSFRIGGPADMFVSPADKDDLIALLRFVKQKKLSSVIIGGGTNLLVRDGGFHGVVINIKQLHAIRIEREYHSVGGMFSVLYVEAGAMLAGALSFAAQAGLTGLEFATGIPGTVGGALCMNAGTAEGEIGDIVDSVSLISPEGEMITRGREAMEFGYRTAKIPRDHLIFDARMILRQGDKAKISGKIQELMEKRKNRLPWGLPSAGSVFKNPQDEAAGKLIELAGLKGKTVGGAQISEKHANIIVNTGNARASDVLELMEIVKAAVLEQRGIRLEPEIRIIGEDA
jgi:UDP-N-acetylmuramate dehydrogenase